MLIDLDYLVSKYNINITGVLHIGAHMCEEMDKYIQYVTKDKVLWVEGNPSLVHLMKEKDPDLVIYHAIISDKVEDVTMYITNNGQSSSILELEQHKIDYPHIVVVDEIHSKSTTIEKLYNDYDIPHDFANFLNMDIQGAELLALVGMGDILHNFKYLYLEINMAEMYKNCALVTQIDDYLKPLGFTRVETSSVGNWGDAFYIRDG